MFKIQYKIKDYRFRLIAYVVILCIIGILAIGSTRPSLQNRQVIGMIVGLIAMTAVSLIDYSVILRLRRIWYLVIVVLLALVLIPGIGHSVSGATRWIQVGGFQFQPSELCKILLILFFAAFFMRYKDKLNTWKVIVASLVLVAIPILLIFREPDLSTTIMVVLIFVTLIFIAGLSYKVILPILAVAVPTVIISLVLMMRESFPFLQPYQYSRIAAWVNPDRYTDAARQQQNSIIAIASGQLWGKGLNNSSIASLKNGNYISEPHTDFIFTIVGEELGFVGCLLVIAMIALIVFECIWISRNAKDIGGRLICCGVGAMIGFQSFMNIGVATGMFPNTGIPLPFVSYGLTSLISMFLGIGLVLNVGLQAGNRETEVDAGTIIHYRFRGSDMSLKFAGKRILLAAAVLSTALFAAGCAQDGEVEQAYSVFETTSDCIAFDYSESGENPMFAADLCVGGIVNSDVVATETNDYSRTAGVFLTGEEEVSYAKNIYAKRYPASTTKILTAYIALKYGDPDQEVTVTASALEDLGYDSSLCYIQAGDTLTLRDLLYGLMLASGNDAANVIAETIAGSQEAFADLMNEEAAALGATRSHFVNAHGLPDDDHYTTAYDMYLIFSEAIKNEDFVDIISTTEYTVSYTDANGEPVQQVWTNTNGYLAGTYPMPEGVTVVGGKTGTTDAAGACLVLLSMNESGDPVISIVMKGNSHDDLYQCMSYILSNYSN